MPCFRGKMKNKLLLLVLCLLLFSIGANCSVSLPPAMAGKVVATIDGGSATKKSPISLAIAKKFNFVYIETGAVYRTVTHLLMQAGIKPVDGNEKKVNKFLARAKYKCSIVDGVAQFTINGVRLSAEQLRSGEINANVAQYGLLFESINNFCMKCISDAVNSGELAKYGGIIAEGRTCGEYLFTDADLKFWFIASNDEKLRFRVGVEMEVDDPIERDRIDFSRTFHPVVRPNGAIDVWPSSRTIEENIAMVSAFIEQKLDAKAHAGRN
jgi:cytidylate kinase